ncbi:hypothetical protein JCM4914_17600 [Streptomyces platensis subsp. malvinus]
MAVTVRMTGSPLGADRGDDDTGQTDDAVDDGADADERQSSVHVTDGSRRERIAVPEGSSCG